MINQAAVAKFQGISRDYIQTVTSLRLFILILRLYTYMLIFVVKDFFRIHSVLQIVDY